MATVSNRKGKIWANFEGPYLKNSKRYEAEIWRICSKCMISNKCAKFEVVDYMALDME